MKLLSFLLFVIYFTGALPLSLTDDEEVLTTLLFDFLAGASVNDYGLHDRFWADDLIYTSAAGDRIGKQDIMNGLAVGVTEPVENLPVYSADEIQIRVYGNAAVVAFILIADIPIEFAGSEQMRFYNTGTFLKREGEWRAVAWQATRIPD